MVEIANFGPIRASEVFHDGITLIYSLFID